MRVKRRKKLRQQSDTQPTFRFDWPVAITGRCDVPALDVPPVLPASTPFGRASKPRHPVTQAHWIESPAPSDFSSLLFFFILFPPSGNWCDRGVKLGPTQSSFYFLFDSLLLSRSLLFSLYSNRDIVIFLCLNVNSAESVKSPSKKLFFNWSLFIFQVNLRRWPLTALQWFQCYPMRCPFH